MRIWRIEWITADRKRTLLKPSQTSVVLPATLVQWIETWVLHRWHPGLLEWGLTFEVMVAMTKAYAYQLKLAYGFSWDLALVGAKANMLNFISTQAAAVAIPVLTLWGGVVLLALYYKTVDFLGRQAGSWTFKSQRCVMAYGDNFWFGSVIRHPEEGMWDVERAFPVNAPLRNEHRDVGGEHSLLDFWDFNELWEGLGVSLLFWHIYYMKQARLNYVNVGWQIDDQVWRVLAIDVENDPFGLPVGFEEEIGRFANWYADWDKYWNRAGGEKGPEF